MNSRLEVYHSRASATQFTTHHSAFGGGPCQLWYYPMLLIVCSIIYSAFSETCRYLIFSKHSKCLQRLYLVLYGRRQSLLYDGRYVELMNVASAFP